MRLSSAGACRVILPITDPYVVHHGALGSFATIYLDPAQSICSVCLGLGLFRLWLNPWGLRPAGRHHIEEGLQNPQFPRNCSFATCPFPVCLFLYVAEWYGGDVRTTEESELQLFPPSRPAPTPTRPATPPPPPTNTCPPRARPSPHPHPCPRARAPTHRTTVSSAHPRFGGVWWLSIVRSALEPDSQVVQPRGGAGKEAHTRGPAPA